MSTNRNLSGLITPTSPKLTVDREPLMGLITPRAKTVAGQQETEADKSAPAPRVVPKISGGLNSAPIRLNSMAPYAVLADGEDWDVRTYPYVRLEGEVGRFILPNPDRTLEEVVGPMDRSASCEASGNARPVPPSTHKSWVIQARVLLPDAVTVADIRSRLAGEVIGQADPLELELGGTQWTLSDLVVTMSGTIRRQLAAGGYVDEPYTVETDLEQLTVGSPSYESVIDLTFYTVDGGAWRAIGARIDV